MKKRDIIILGGGYSADEILPIIKKDKNKYKIKAILDDNKKYHKKNHRGIPVHVGLENASKFKDCLFVFGIGSYKNKNSREKILKKTNLKKEQFPNIIDPSVVIEDGVKLGYGNIIYPFCNICSETVIEDFCILTHSTIIAHNVTLKSFTTVGSRSSILGNSKIGKEVFIGANVLIGENIRVGDYSRVIIGTSLFKSIKNKHMVFGNPIKILKL